MTEIAERPAAADAGGAELAHINHWINGQLVAGTSGRRGPVYDPATGRQSKWVDFASVEEVDAAVAAAAGSIPRRGARRRCRGGRRSCSASATWSTSIARRSRRS